MTLTDTTIRQAKPKAKPYKLFDGDGLFLLVTPTGGKWWRFKYCYAGKEKLLSVGTFPKVSLKEARSRRDLERKKLDAQIDPAINRKATKASWAGEQDNTFEVIARELIQKKSTTWSESYLDKVVRRLEMNVFPWLGRSPITSISAPVLLSTLHRIEARRAHETAHRVLYSCGQVFRYAIATGRATHNPAADLRDALTPAKRGHFAAVTEPKSIGPLLRALDAYQGTLVVRCALRLAPLVFVRPVELRMAEWQDIDFETASWNIPAGRMKMKVAHLIPLSSQALNILRELHPLTGRGRFLFPSPRTPLRPMSDNAVLSAMRRMGIDRTEMTGHGFRAMARTVLDEVLKVRPDYIEHQLAHAVRDPNGRAYNRTAHIEERRKMMQQWADYLDELKADAGGAEFKRAA